MLEDDEVRAYNTNAWNEQAKKGETWSTPVTPEVIADARDGKWSVVLTPNIPVPRDWFPSSLDGVRLLGLASAGGQQMPTFAAAGAKVTVIDASPGQLELDRNVAEREGLSIETIVSDMADLSALQDASFDLVFHPVSNCFSPEVLGVWREVARVLVPGGLLLAGFTNPVVFLLDPDAHERGDLVIRYKMPYSDAQLSAEERKRYEDIDDPLVYGHSLEDQIGGQLRAGLVLTDMFEDHGLGKKEAVDQYLPGYIATRAVKR